MNGKKIGVLTLQNSNNFGAMYQAYALSRYLQDLGHEVIIVDYEMTRDNGGVIGHVKHPISCLQKLFYRKDLVLGRLFRKKSEKFFVDRKNKFYHIFENFRHLHLTITSKKYNYSSLLCDAPSVDVFICGSDQVWAADFLFTSPAFLLGFAPEGTKKVSYAASFGKARLEPYLKKVFSDNLSSFDSVSVREKSGVDIVKAVAKRDSELVLDPTLLLDKADYVELIDYSLVPSSPYIFVYKLDQKETLSDWMDLCINEIRNDSGLSVLAVSTNLSHSFDGRWEEIYPTPGQMLGLIDKSSLTITNSFHGAVFSILLKSKFLVFARDEYLDKQNIRMEDILESLGLGRFYCPPFLDEQEVVSKTGQDYDFERVFERLNKLRIGSKKFLETAIQ